MNSVPTSQTGIGLREKQTVTAQKKSKYGSFSGPYFFVFGLNTSKYGKIRTRKISVFGHFLRSEGLKNVYLHYQCYLSAKVSRLVSSLTLS